MGGKRPDQYNIDPSEAGATDYKTLPQTGRGNSDALDTVEGDKQRLAQGQQNAKGQPFLPDTPAPSRDVNQGVVEASRTVRGAADADPDPENPAV